MEQFANLSETTLAADYVAGQGFLDVVSTSGFPSLPVFRVRLSNTARTIFRVEWIYGTRFYGTVEENDGNATSGIAVIIVISAAVLNRFLQSPDTGAISDRIYAPSGAGGYGPLFKGWDTIPDLTTWTWVNQGGATIVEPYVGSPVQMQCPTGGGTSLRILQTALPASPFEITAGFICDWTTAGSVSSLQAAGLELREAATGKIKFHALSNFKFSTANPPRACWVGLYGSATSATSVTGERSDGTEFFLPSNPGWGAFFGVAWLRLRYDGINFYYSFSVDRLNWIDNVAEAKATGFTTAPDQLCVIGTCQSGPTTVFWLVSWEQKTTGLAVQPSAGATAVTGQLVTRSP